MLKDTDPWGFATPLGGPWIHLRRTCLEPVDQSPPECTNPFNGHEGLP
jgi:hypothetical protein